MAVRIISRIALMLALAGALPAAPRHKPVKAARVATKIETTPGDAINPQSLRGHLSFLASDLLEGRSTPSRGQEIAAAYIASQFRRAGLQPGGDDGYFQTARMVSRAPSGESSSLRVNDVSVGGAELSGTASHAVDAANVPVVKITKDTSPPDVDGKLVLTTRAMLGKVRRSLRDAKPLAIISVAKNGKTRGGPGPAQLVDAANAAPDILFATSQALFEEFDRMPEGATKAQAEIHLAAPQDTPVLLHNVIAVLPGSDPVLKDTYVILSAHYDHLPPADSGEDRIYNGANDNGSGTVSVLEIASALARMEPRPKRSIVFLTFFGEELGILGSEYYARHPALPLDKTVAQINLEQMGRTDDTRGPQRNRAAVTGFDYSDVGPILEAAGREKGVTFYKPGAESDSFFSRSDNLPLARAGVPAHTVGVTFEFPDYHQPGDEWEKIDYDNMARVDQAVAAALIRIAGDPSAPRWNKANRNAEPYFQARP